MLSPCRSSREISDATLILPCGSSIFAQLCYAIGTFASSGCEPGCAVSQGLDLIRLSLESLDQHLAAGGLAAIDPRTDLVHDCSRHR
jgi:hypothetical protein